MPCDSVYRPGQSLAQRNEEITRTLKALERALAEKRVKIAIGPTGGVAFEGWRGDARNGVSDACAYRSLSSEGSWELRKAVAAAEQASGKRVNPQAVAAGHHAHDGVWHKGH